MACLLAAALLTACGDGSQSTPTEPLADTPTPASDPLPESPGSTPAPPSPPETLTPEPASAPLARDFVIEMDTVWQELFDKFTNSEQSCIRTALGNELLASVLDQPVMAAPETQPWEVSIFGCLAPEAASELFLSAFTRGWEGLTEENEACLQNLIIDVDVASMIASTLPSTGPVDALAVQDFMFGLLTCLPDPFLLDSFAPSPTDDSLLWQYSTDGWVVNAPTVAGGVVYVGSDDNHVYAIDAETGALLWSFQTGDVIRSTPTVTGGVVYIGSNDNLIYALDASTGALLWQHDTGDWVQYSPTVREGTVYLGALADGDHKIHALDAVTGEQLWVAEMPYPFTPEFAPTVAGDNVYVPGAFGEFHALDAATGALAWSFDAGIPVESAPAIVEGVVYLTAVNTAYALDESTGALIWSYGTERFPARSFPAIVVDGVYYFSPDDHLYALDAATGEVLWFHQADAMISTSPLVADGMVYAGSEAGSFYAWDAASGDLIWSHQAGEPALDSPTVADGILYAESTDGHLRALHAASGELTWSFQKGYVSGIQAYTVTEGVLYVSALDGGVYAFTAPAGK
ncbi:MAG: PQQ-binding-like beta-propeller repeat protein [Chloroflexi bacterium]|nr:PQQ-binding-like beta-propeller repeat protein [Chloroflexota bacterium]